MADSEGILGVVKGAELETERVLDWWLKLGLSDHGGLAWQARWGRTATPRLSDTPTTTTHAFKVLAANRYSTNTEELNIQNGVFGTRVLLKGSHLLTAITTS